MCVLVEGSKWVRLPSVCGSKCVLVPSQSGFQVSVRRIYSHQATTTAFVVFSSLGQIPFKDAIINMHAMF